MMKMSMIVNIEPDVLWHEARDEDAQEPEHTGHHEHPGVAHDSKQGRNLVGKD